MTKEKLIVLDLTKTIYTLPKEIQKKIYEYLEFIRGVYTVCDSFSKKSRVGILLHIVDSSPSKVNDQEENVISEIDSPWNISFRRRLKPRSLTF
jgi:hypothetical protein